MYLQKALCSSNLVKQNSTTGVKQIPTPSSSSSVSTSKQKDTSEDLSSYLEVWNKNCGSLSKITGLSDKRRAKLKTRTAEGLTLETFIRLVNACAKTPFLRGDNDRQWKADFDWLITMITGEECKKESTANRLRAEARGTTSHDSRHHI